VFEETLEVAIIEYCIHVTVSHCKHLCIYATSWHYTNLVIIIIITHCTSVNYTLTHHNCMVTATCWLAFGPN